MKYLSSNELAHCNTHKLGGGGTGVNTIVNDYSVWQNLFLSLIFVNKKSHKT